MKKKQTLAICSLSALLGIVLLAGCGKKESAEEQPAANPSAGPGAAPIASTRLYRLWRMINVDHPSSVESAGWAGKIRR